MSDLISREALCKYCLNIKDRTVDANDIMRFPSAEPEWKKGKWWHYDGQYSCLICGAEFDDISSFCPNCGADMRGDEDWSER